MSPCPSPETLSRLARDSSSGSHFATMEAHVQMCANCQEVLERLAEDASVSEGRGPGRPAEPEHSPTIPGFVIEGVLGRGEWGSSIRRGSRNWPATLPSRSSARTLGSVWRIAGAGYARRRRSGGSAIPTSFSSTTRANKTAVSTSFST